MCLISIASEVSNAGCQHAVVKALAACETESTYHAVKPRRWQRAAGAGVPLPLLELPGTRCVSIQLLHLGAPRQIGKPVRLEEPYVPDVRLEDVFTCGAELPDMSNLWFTCCGLS